MVLNFAFRCLYWFDWTILLSVEIFSGMITAGPLIRSGPVYMKWISHHAARCLVSTIHLVDNESNRLLAWWAILPVLTTGWIVLDGCINCHFPSSLSIRLITGITATNGYIKNRIECRYLTFHLKWNNRVILNKPEEISQAIKWTKVLGRNGTWKSFLDCWIWNINRPRNICVAF